VGAATPVAGLRLGEEVTYVGGWFEEGELAVLDGGVGRWGEVLWWPERVHVGPC